MPTFYKRKPGAKPRGQWGPERLQEAIQRINAGDISFREAERYYGVPARTIKRRRTIGNLDEPRHRPPSSLGRENEARLVNHINRLGDAGFCPDRTAVRRLAYEFATALKLDHKFNTEKNIAGYDWLWSFLRRNPDLRIRESQGLSMMRGRGLTREAARTFYNLLENEVKEHGLQDKPQNIFNVDETGIQLINKVGKVIAKKGAKVVKKITTGEKGETVSMVACCSAEGRFLPPSLIYKGKDFKREFEDGLPPGSTVYMNHKSAYINSDIFFKWFKEEFISRKSPGRNILILDGHCSHCSSLALLMLADENDISLLCLPPHSTHALQPLDKSFFGPFKGYFQTEINTWVEQHVGRKLTRYQVGALICKAWNKSASVGNGTSGLKATGIYPLDRNALPDHYFTISDNIVQETDDQQTSQLTLHSTSNTIPSTKQQTQPHFDPQPSTSMQSCFTNPEPETPTKYLFEISPVPKLDFGKRKKGVKKGAVLLTSKEHMKQMSKDIKSKQEKNLVKQQKIKPQLEKRKLNFTTVNDSDVDDPRLILQNMKTHGKRKNQRITISLK